MPSLPSSWSLQDAKNRFSAVVDAALSGKVQLVTRRGKPAVVILSVDEYQRLKMVADSTPSLAEHLLQMPQDNGAFERQDIEAREFIP